MKNTIKESIEQFKRDLRSLTFYKNKLDEINDKLLALRRVMHEARSNRYDHEIGGHPMNYLDLMQKEEKLQQDQQLYEILLQRIAVELEKLDTEERTLLLDLYVHKKSFASISMKLYMSERNLKYHVDQVLKRIL